MIVTAFAALLIPTVEHYEKGGFNIYSIVINGNDMGTVDTVQDAERVLNDARRQVAKGSEDLMLIDAKIDINGNNILRGVTDPEEQVFNNIVAEFEKSVKSTMHRSFSVKIDDYMVNVASEQDVVSLLEASLGRYDENQIFKVSLNNDKERQLPVLTPEIINTSLIEEPVDKAPEVEDYLGPDGVFKAFGDILENVEIDIEPGFDDYNYGITDMKFANKVEIVESYIPSKQIKTLETAIDEVTKDKEQKTIYEVVSGDTLSGISNKTGISVDDLVALNDMLENERSVIHIGDELTITVPKPELSVSYEKLTYYEGTYEADVIYIYNDGWYTTEEKTLQDPVSGYHKAVEKTTYLNGDITSSEIIREDIIAEAVPKIVEKGTKIPPSYIWPCSSYRITSYFGYRTSTMRGMTSNHQAVDIGCPIGTSVWASCGGTVVHAGWMSSYGYCVFINHPDGKQTRYAHLSKILVSKGQSVSQGQKIALSGNTGVSTGPHLHFEMRKGGVPVNPLNYVE